MSAKPLISFIVYSHDAEPANLRACLDSILQLSLADADREIIIVDNGETSAPLSMLLNNEYEITYIHLKRKGASAAYALALRLSTGRYVQLVGSTDRLLRAPYEHCLDIARYHNPDVMFYKNTDNASDATTPFTYEGPMLGSTYMKGNTIQAAKIGYMFEKSLIVSEEFNERIANKNEFLTKLLLRSERFYYTDAYAYLASQQTAQSAADGSIHANRLAETEKTLVNMLKLVVPETDRPALNRRIAQLTMDYLCDVIRTTHDKKTLVKTMERLARKGLYPLPDRNYTKKYAYFRKMIGNPITRNLLFYLIK